MSTPPPCAICGPPAIAGHYCGDCESFVCWRCWNLDVGMCKECERDWRDSEIAAKHEEPVEEPEPENFE